MRNCCSALLALSCLLGGPAVARILTLQNDSAVDGDEIAFYPRGAEEDVFSSIYALPDDLVEFKPCRILVWVGPRDFVVMTARVDIVDELNGEFEFVWNGGLDAFQIPGSRDSLSAIDLRDERLEVTARHIRVTVQHAPGFAGPPTIATDTDGITPHKNAMLVFTRQGDWAGWSEDRPEDDQFYPRPLGDWILRLQVANLNDVCPGPNDPIGPRPDMGVELDQGPPPDMRVDPRPDARVPRPDMRAPDPDAEWLPDVPDEPKPDAFEPTDDATVVPDLGRTGFDFGLRPGTFVVDRMVPNRGTGTQNLDVVVSGRGFPAGESVTAFLGDFRLLEAQARSDSTITAIVPAGMPVGTYNLEVERADGQVAILPEAFNVAGPDMLTLSAVTPQALAEGETAELTISGAGFDATTTFEVGTARLQDVVVQSPTVARGVLKATLVAGLYDLVARRGEQEAQLTAALQVLRPGSKASDDCGCSAGDTGLGWTPLLLMVVCLRRRRR